MSYDRLALMRELSEKNDTKIVLLVMDGLGGLPFVPGGPTELEAAQTPNIDRIAPESVMGLSLPVAPGVTPGSGPGHLGLFGYDPLKYLVGRGALEAVGIGMDIQEGDVAFRGNFATIDAAGNITDRRAGRIATEEAEKRVKILQGIQVPGIETAVEEVREYRFVLRLRGPNLSPELAETDPQATGVPPLAVKALDPKAQYTADLTNQWIAKAKEALKDQAPANMVMLRGAAGDPALPKYADVFGLRAAAIAVYPMYRGVASLVGMDVLKPLATKTSEEIALMRENWAKYDFFFMHVKYTDSRGEDGNFDAKVKIIEEADSVVPDILALKPDVLVITGDHSTPAALRSHSWHPVPLLIWAKTARPDGYPRWFERQCRAGGLGHVMAADIMPLAMAHALRLKKYGA
ncbi:MAG: 2,3-bisphosphoglycerate-independent phosphoglycerate mutase [Anaerolineae bacterium]